MISPAREAEERIKAAGVCSQCLGRGVYRTLVKYNGKITETLADCPRCKGKKQ